MTKKKQKTTLTMKTKKYQKKIREDIAKAKKTLREHYKNIVAESGKNWEKESKKYEKKIKAGVSKAEKKMTKLVKQNPAGAAVAAAAVGAVLGAIAVSLVRRKK